MAILYPGQSTQTFLVRKLMPTPQGLWSHKALDFITDLTKYLGNTNSGHPGSILMLPALDPISGTALCL